MSLPEPVFSFALYYTFLSSFLFSSRPLLGFEPHTECYSCFAYKVFGPIPQKPIRSRGPFSLPVATQHGVIHLLHIIVILDAIVPEGHPDLTLLSITGYRFLQSL